MAFPPKKMALPNATPPSRALPAALDDRIAARHPVKVARTLLRPTKYTKGVALGSTAILPGPRPFR